jgi:hypothetical protein
MGGPLLWGIRPKLAREMHPENFPNFPVDANRVFHHTKASETQYQ